MVPEQPSANSAGPDGAKPEPSPFTPPQISLPAGGGAIRGIGEKFTASSATGTGKLTIPLAVSPGRSGFAPQLTLAYDSGSGNGPFGIGWSLSSPAITRKTDKGLPRYRPQESAECDVFILSGAEDLVPVLVGDGQGGWRDDEFEYAGHRVKRYRPRIEGLFARIERWTRLEDGDEHWRSISKDNTLTVYGRDRTARICDPHDPRRVFSWLICESYDDKGNAIGYEYVAEDAAGVDLQNAGERGRVRTANRYPKRIRYGNRRPLLLVPDAPGFRVSHLEVETPGSTGWLFEVVFDYGDGYCGPDPNHPWPVRKDPFSTYRPGFEVRTYRLCQRVLMFHHFPDEAVGAGCLVKSTEFEYRQKPVGSFIAQVTQSGYARQEDGRYLRKSMPPLELDYTTSPLEDARHEHYRVREVDPASVDNLPAGIDGRRYQWVDLNGEGVSGVLNQDATAWYYTPNAGKGHLGPTALVRSVPSLAATSRAQQQLLDLAGQGALDLVTFEPSAAGFHERTLLGGWGHFRTFRSLPVLNFKAPNLRFVDLTGDGIADILITEDDAFTWHPSLLHEGFGAAIRVTIPFDEREGPHIIFDDGIQSIYLADMSGDGLSDLVRIRNGEVCYWPNIGYGKFGGKVVMDNAPWFEDEDLFEQSRVKLADTDGSGTVDIVYLAHDGIRIYLNQSGNGWSDARVLPPLPALNDLTSVSVVDFLGRGTACLLWSSILPADSRRPLRYLDLMDGQKPHLLTRIRNNLGAETRIEYASSAEFYLADKAAGKPWLTRLPFPVQVVKRVVTYDYVSRNRFVSSYTYHHGFFDGLEREFRGFGRVEQLDTEEFATLSGSDSFPTATNIERASNVPPVLTKTWFHTGVFLGSGRISRHLAHEYYSEPAPASVSDGHDPRAPMLLEDSALPETLTAPEAREACRALKGSVLRQEVYALDGNENSSQPYTVSESNWTIAYVQPRWNNLHAVFFSHAREAVTFNYERKLYRIDGALRADPRVTHTVTLDVDDYGNVLKSVAVGYGRRFDDPAPLLSDLDRTKQRQTLITYTENRYTNPVLERDAYRAPVVADSRIYELIRVEPSTIHPRMADLFRFDELRAQVGVASDGQHDLPYEDLDALQATTSAPYRRLIEETRTYYRSDTLERLLPFGKVEALALPGQTYRLAFTRDMLAKVYRRHDPPENLIPDVRHLLHEVGRYVDLLGDSRWWVPSGRVFYAPEASEGRAELEQARRQFFLPRRFVDAFGNVTTVAYDPHNLAPVRIRDAVGNTTGAEIDYRVLEPWRTTDANGNRTAAAFDALGRVVGTAVMGKHGQSAGDSLDDFIADLDEATVLQHLHHPLRDPEAILQLATTRLLYDLFAYVRTRDSADPQPAAVYTLARETHAADLGPGQRTRIQHLFSYSDGFGREIQRKVRAEPGPLGEGGPPVQPRWIGSGWTIFNNKGKPVRQYEPFFSALHEFEFARQVGISPILFYDPLQRVVATLHPNHTYQKVVFDPWRQATWDVNDTVLQTDPALDPDVGRYLENLPRADFLPVWYDQRRDGQLGKDEQRAALQSALHANTPGVSYLDCLGRLIVTLEHNRIEREGRPLEEFFATRTAFDIEGNQRCVIDALDRPIVLYDYGMLKMRLRQVSVDAGILWTLNDAAGKSLRTWDSLHRHIRREYDALHRPTTVHVRTGGGPEILAEQVVYGEGQFQDVALNLRTRPFRRFDGAGMVTLTAYDFKGNLSGSTRQFLRDYKCEADWARPLELEEARFKSATRFDALNRPIEVTTADGSVAKPKYNETNLLESLSVNLRDSKSATPFVTHIEYDAKRQRQVIEYGNGVVTRFSYDPLTFRLIRLVTRRQAGHALLQDLNYTFDPIGNITAIRDHAQETLYFKGQVVGASNEYVYDALYRLLTADGREHAGAPCAPQTTFDDLARMHYPLPSDGRALHRYREQYEYDAVGNILRLAHCAGAGNWSRSYEYDRARPPPGSNRLASTRVGQSAGDYGHDTAGNMTRMPHLAALLWDFKNQLHATRRQVAHAGQGETTYYLYDSAGQRVRKVTERASGSRLHERLYLGGLEIFRKYDSVGGCKLERETLHVMDGRRRLALVETKTIDISSERDRGGAEIRYLLGNHLGSAVLELDRDGDIASYEEYYPYGSTSYQARRSQTEIPNRYRYTGKERDEESGLYYHGARYYACWLGRWTSADPTGLADGNNLYRYVADNPVRMSDPSGTQGEDDDTPNFHLVEVPQSGNPPNPGLKLVWDLPVFPPLIDWTQWRPFGTPDPPPEPKKPNDASPINPQGNYQSGSVQDKGKTSLSVAVQGSQVAPPTVSTQLSRGVWQKEGWGGLELIENNQIQAPKGEITGGSASVGAHLLWGPDGSRNNVSGYLLGTPQNAGAAPGGGWNPGLAGTAVYERLIGGPDRDHPRLVLGANLGVAWQHVNQLTAVGSPDGASTYLRNPVTGTGVASLAWNVHYLDGSKIPRFTLTAELYGTAGGSRSGLSDPNTGLALRGHTIGGGAGLAPQLNLRHLGDTAVISAGVNFGWRGQRDTVGGQSFNAGGFYGGVFAGVAWK
jgi:RHS repeat-associated protein